MSLEHTFVGPSRDGQDILTLLPTNGQRAGHDARRWHDPARPLRNWYINGDSLHVLRTSLGPLVVFPNLSKFCPPLI